MLELNFITKIDLLGITGLVLNKNDTLLFAYGLKGKLIIYNIENMSDII
jgi:hypothetical protein